MWQFAFIFLSLFEICVCALHIAYWMGYFQLLSSVSALLFCYAAFLHCMLSISLMWIWLMTFIVVRYCWVHFSMFVRCTIFCWRIHRIYDILYGLFAALLADDSQTTSPTKTRCHFYYLVIISHSLPSIPSPLWHACKLVIKYLYMALD